MEIAKPDDARFTCGHGAPPRKSTLRVGWADGAYVARRWPRPRPRRAPRRARGPERGEWRRQSRAKPKRGCLGRAAAARGRARAPLARAAAPHHAHIAQRPEALRQRGQSCSTTPRSRTRSTCSTTTARARGSRFKKSGASCTPSRATAGTRGFARASPGASRGSRRWSGGRPLLSKEPRRSARQTRNTSASGRTVTRGSGTFFWRRRAAPRTDRNRTDTSLVSFPLYPRIPRFRPQTPRV